MLKPPTVRLFNCALNNKLLGIAFGSTFTKSERPLQSSVVCFARFSGCSVVISFDIGDFQKFRGNVVYASFCGFAMTAYETQVSHSNLNKLACLRTKI